MTFELVQVRRFKNAKVICSQGSFKNGCACGQSRMRGWVSGNENIRYAPCRFRYTPCAEPFYYRSLLALKIKPDIAAKAKENMLATQNNNAASACQKSDKQIDTKKEVAKLAGVSHDTIAKVEKIEKHATPEVKAAVKSGKFSSKAKLYQ